MLNRRVMRLPLFQEPGDYEAFQRIMAQGLRRSDAPLLPALRYVEANALRAQLAERAQEWRWGSLWVRRHGP
ncbi:MAG: hypothetical protein MUC88_01380, partial [Planctomycetes bacterium]|nr:hypothetical protein [Planctomycetota bacterium]